VTAIAEEPASARPIADAIPAIPIASAQPSITSVLF